MADTRDLRESEFVRYGHRAVRAYLAYVPGAAWEYDELLSDALLGIAKAIKRWSPLGGATLRTYVWYRMRGEILDGRRRRGDMTRRELSEHLSMTDLPQDRQHAMSLSTWTHPDPDDGASDEPASPAAAEAFAAMEARVALEPLIDSLSEREREVVQRVDLDGETLRTVGNDLGVTESRVSQIRARAHKRMTFKVQTGHDLRKRRRRSSTPLP